MSAPSEGDALSQPGEAPIGDAAGREPPPQYCPVEIERVAVPLPAQHGEISLRELGGEGRRLRIPIGLAEASAIEFARQAIATPRPLTHELFATILAVYGVSIEAVRISSLDGSYRAELLLNGPMGSRTIDCRPSDGIALALRQPLVPPITAAARLLDQGEASASA
jgi:bifunctional DNase/RNase